MVLFVTNFSLLPDKAEAYAEWVGSAIQRQLAVPGLIELRGYRPITGTHQIVATYEFADLASWAAWREHEDIQAVNAEVRAFVSEVNYELWGPSPVAPEPIRSRG